MFDDDSGRYQARRPVDPPVDVVVTLARVFPPTRVRWGQATPLWIRAVGVQVGGEIRGRLSEWVLTSTGDWLGRCHIAVRVDDCVLELDQLIPAAALRPTSA